LHPIQQAKMAATRQGRRWRRPERRTAVATTTTERQQQLAMRCGIETDRKLLAGSGNLSSIDFDLIGCMLIRHSCPAILSLLHVALMKSGSLAAQRPSEMHALVEALRG
jgi:hypothetical protein